MFQESVTALPVSVVVVDDLKNSTTCADGEIDTDTVLANASCKTPEVSLGINFTKIVLETPEIFISFSKSPPDDAADEESFVSQTISAPVLAFPAFIPSAQGITSDEPPASFRVQTKEYGYPEEPDAGEASKDATLGAAETMNGK